MRFNTTGPCNPEWQYMVPAAARLPGARVPGAPRGRRPALDSLRVEKLQVCEIY